MLLQICFYIAIASTTLATLLEDLGLGLLERHNHLSRRQTVGSNYTCRLNYTTNLWSSCAQVLQEFNLTLDAFQDINPSISDNCENFNPGSMYCVAAAVGDALPISSNGLCGVQQNWTNTCIGSQWGDCCVAGRERITAGLETARRAHATEHRHLIVRMAYAEVRTTGLNAPLNSGYAAASTGIAGMVQISAVPVARAALVLGQQRPPAPHRRLRRPLDPLVKTEPAALMEVWYAKDLLLVIVAQLRAIVALMHTHVRIFLAVNRPMERVMLRDMCQYRVYNIGGGTAHRDK
ncbi:carbohydrate-binding module family 18 protein [Hypoxylon sp. NC0597]|nr:carbohydrate-binding module family 18 protein [Hypoxylon sp. NC0597]